MLTACEVYNLMHAYTLDRRIAATEHWVLSPRSQPLRNRISRTAHNRIISNYSVSLSVSFSYSSPRTSSRIMFKSSTAASRLINIRDYYQHDNYCSLSININPRRLLSTIFSHLSVLYFIFFVKITTTNIPNVFSTWLNNKNSWVSIIWVNFWF